jgi:L-rhamnose isomerase/sugar isomerase
MACRTLKDAFNTDITPILQKLRLEKGGAIHLIQTYRNRNYRKLLMRERT